MTDISKTHRLVIDPVTKKGTLVPIAKRYDVSTELQRRASAKRPKLATRAKAKSLPELERSDRGTDGR